MIKRLVPLILAATVLLSCAGCFDYKDIEESALVAGIAIDKGVTGYDVTAEILSMKSESSSEAAPNPIVVTKSAETVAGALETIVETNVRKLYFGHCVVVLLSKEIAEEGIRDLVDLLFHDNRINVSLDMIVVKKGRAADIFKCKPVRGSLVSFDLAKALEETSQDNSTTKSVKVYECINAMENPGGEAFLPAVTFEDNDGEQRFSVQGLSVFKEDKLVGFLSEKESMYFLMMTDSLNNGSLELEMSEGEYLHFNVVSSKIGIDISSRDSTTVKLDIRLYLSLMRIPEGVDLQKKDSVIAYEKTVSEKIKTDLMSCIHKIRDGYKSDILSYGFLLYKATPDLFYELAEGENGYFQMLDFDVNVSVGIESSGLSDLPINKEK